MATLETAAPVTVQAEPAGMTGNGRAYNVFDGTGMKHDRTIPDPATITVKQCVRPASTVNAQTTVTWSAGDCKKCRVPATAKTTNQPCVHQQAAIARHVELFGAADTERLVSRFDGAELIGLSDVVSPENLEEPTEPDELDDCPRCGNRGVEVIDAVQCMDTGAQLVQTRCVFCGEGN